MKDITKVEAYYRKCIVNLPHCLPEGVVNVDLKLLQCLDLLDFEGKEFGQEDVLTRYFHVVESDDKITLINDLFVIWIVPESTENQSSTYTMIALNRPQEPKLEMVFSVSGIYNTSRMVLRVLEKYLHDIQENEEELTRLDC